MLAKSAGSVVVASIVSLTRTCEIFCVTDSEADEVPELELMMDCANLRVVHELPLFKL